MDGKQATRTRDEILDLLSDEEIARVSMAEGGLSLPPGAEYVDLERIGSGIQRVGELKPKNLNSVLPRIAVGAETWDRIRDLLES